jgi:hypothetical protein
VIATSFVERWIWPAGGSGGIPGDVVGTLVWVVLAAVATTVLYPPLRHAAEAFVKRHLATEHAELHAKLDHIIKHHPDIPPYEKKQQESPRRTSE